MVTRILVQSEPHQLKSRPDSEKRLKHEEFHIVDLERGTIYLRISSPLLSCSGIGSMLSLGDFVYMFCGPDTLTKIASCKSQSSADDSFYTGAARLQIVNGDNGKGSGLWCQNLMQISGCWLPCCTCLDGKIYNFGFGLLCPQVFDPTTNHWEAIPLPLEFQGCRVSITVLPDPSANRIILRLEKGPLLSPSLYAFYPKLGDWKLLVSNFLDWKPLAAFSDDVIYFHQRKCPSLLRAYDLKNLKWLDVHWSKTVIDGWNITEFVRARFKHLLSLGDNSFCLSTTWCVLPKSKSICNPDSDSNSDYCDDDDDDDDSIKCRVVFLKFRSERTDSTINLVLLSARSFILPHTSYVHHMVPIS